MCHILLWAARRCTARCRRSSAAVIRRQYRVKIPSIARIIGRVATPRAARPFKQRTSPIRKSKAVDPRKTGVSNEKAVWGERNDSSRQQCSPHASKSSEADARTLAAEPRCGCIAQRSLRSPHCPHRGASIIFSSGFDRARRKAQHRNNAGAEQHCKRHVRKNQEKHKLGRKSTPMQVSDPAEARP